MTIYITHPPPREVPGYDAALAAGLVPRLPADPPALLPGTTAEQMSRRWIISIPVTGVAFAVAYNVIGHVAAGHHGLRSFLLFLASGGALVFVVHGLNRVGYRNVEELDHGYTTTKVASGSYFQTLSFRRSRQAGRVEWDYSGIWVLDVTGGVISAPDHRTDPPGYYPSPNRPGEFELWTGHAWAGDYRPEAAQRRATTA